MKWVKVEIKTSIWEDLDIMSRVVHKLNFVYGIGLAIILMKFVDEESWGWVSVVGFLWLINILVYLSHLSYSKRKSKEKEEKKIGDNRKTNKGKKD